MSVGRDARQWRLWSGATLGSPYSGDIDRVSDNNSGRLARIRVNFD